MAAVTFSCEPPHLVQGVIHELDTIREWLLTYQISLNQRKTESICILLQIRLQLLTNTGIDKIFDQKRGTQLNL